MGEPYRAYSCSDLRNECGTIILRFRLLGRDLQS